MMNRIQNNVSYTELDECVEGSSEDESLENFRSNDVNSTINSTFDSISSKTSQYHSSDSNISYIQESYKSHHPARKEKGISFAIPAVLVGVLMLGVFITYIRTPEHVDECSFSLLRTRYPNQDDTLWEFLESGIDNILKEKSDKPGVYLFLQPNKNESLINDIVVRSSKCFDPNSKPIEMKNVLTALDAVNDYGYAIKEFKKKIKKGSTFLIADLNEISAEAARALHVICDTYNPIVSKVIIFLTLVTHKIDYEHENPVNVAENALTELWGSKLESNELLPLITRITDQVLLLKNE